MLYTLCRNLVLVALFLVSIMVIIHAMEKIDPAQGLISPELLNNSGVKDLDVEYVNGKIYLNVKLTEPKTCQKLIDTLKIQPIVVKTRTYQPTCTKISDTLMRVIYTQSISV